MMVEDKDNAEFGTAEERDAATEVPVFRPRRILEILGEHDVEYVLIGGVAGTLHGAPFVTSDVDVVPALETGNLDRLGSALQELDAVMRADDQPGGISLEFTGRRLKKWLANFQLLSLTTKYGYLDVLFKPSGTAGFRDLARSAVEEEIGTFTIRLASLADIIRCKQATGRPRDLEQLPTLRRLLEIQREENE